MRMIDADAFKAYIRNAYEQVKHMYPDGGEWARQITEDFCKDIDEQPTIEPQKWIPVSERLPSDEDYDETFTVTIQCEHYDGWDDYVTGYADWTPHGWDIQPCYIGQIKVIAWMPLPEPWKGE